MSEKNKKKNRSLVLNRTAGDQVFVLKDGKQIVDILIQHVSQKVVKLSIRSADDISIITRKSLPIYDIDNPQ